MSDEFKNWSREPTDEQKKNYELCMKYPILIPINHRSGRRWDGYEYEFTELQLVPTGWNTAFGEQWASEIQDVIDKMPESKRSEVHILDLKEKYGVLRQYFSYHTDELDEVIRKYEKISKNTCVLCGAPATKISVGWISPYCDECADKKTYLKFVPISER